LISFIDVTLDSDGYAASAEYAREHERPTPARLPDAPAGRSRTLAPDDPDVKAWRQAQAAALHA
jgi:hypothetical protein